MTARARTRWRKQHPVREFWRHTDHEQIEVCRGLQQHMIVPRWPPEDVPLSCIENLFTHAKLGATGRHPIEFGLVMKMAGSRCCGNVSPDVAPRGGWNGKRLVGDTREHNRSVAPAASSILHAGKIGWASQCRCP